MPHLPYQPRPTPMSIAPLATPLPREMEELPLPAEPVRASKPRMPEKQPLPTKPRLRSNRVGLDTISIDRYEPDPDDVYRHVTGGKPNE